MAKKKTALDASKITDIKSLEEAVNTKYGDGTLRVGSDSIVAVDSIPTNIVTLDKALGCKGIPKGRIIEIYGPESSGKTTLCLQIAAAVQNSTIDGRPGRVAFIDAEHALDKVWATNLGCDVDAFVFCQPDYGEQAYEVAEMIAASGQVDLIICDSVPAMVPKAILEGDIADHTIGLAARLNSTALTKIKGVMADKDCTLIMINQIREKIGVMFGCLHGDTLVSFVDGRSLPIKEIVENKVGGFVWSYNEKTKEFEPKEIIDWHNNGVVENIDDYLHISLRGAGTKNGCMQITVTPDHEVFSDGGFVPASDLCVGDKLITKQDCFVINDATDGLNGSLGQFLSGILSADSHISKNKKKYGASLKIRDNIDVEYMNWKIQKLSEMKFSKYDCNSGHFYSSKEYSEFAQIKELYPNRDPMLLLNNFSWLGFAVWIMDDAVFERNRYQLSVKRFKGDFEKLDEISMALDELELYHHMSKGGRITFDVESSKTIFSNIFSYVPKCMERKLPKNYQNNYKDFELKRDKKFSVSEVLVSGIRKASSRQMKNKNKYDISVKDNKNYMAGGNPLGVIVHNSPETTPGGRALKFYASVRMDIRRIGQFKDGDNIVGNQVRVKIVKNKVAPPFKEAIFYITFGEHGTMHGIDPYLCLLEQAKTEKIVTMGGSWYKYEGENIGNGLVNAAKVLRSDPELYSKLYNHILNGSSECIKPPSTKPEASST